MASRAISRRTGSKPDRMTVSGVSSMIRSIAGGLLEGPDVAALAADDPALHLVRRQVDDRDGVLGGVVGGDALHRRDDDVAGLVLGLLAGTALDRAGDLDGVVLGLLADGLDEDGLGVLGRHARDALEGRDLLLLGARQLLAGLVELALAVEELAVALLEHVAALVELLVALEEPASRAPESSLRRARASSSASRCIRSFSSLASRISSFWRARASASIRRASACAAFIVWDAHRLRTSAPSTAPPSGGHEGHRHERRQCVHLSSSRPVRLCGRTYQMFVDGDRSMGVGRRPPLGARRPIRR